MTANAIYKKYRDKNIVIGTHGTALSTIINYYDHTYGFQDFMAMVSILPWVVKMEFDENEFVKMEKIDLLKRNVLEEVLRQYGVEKGADIKKADIRAWIIPELEKNGTSFESSLMDKIFAFESVYKTLPRQIIHRDMHPRNMLYEGSVFTGYLDFDLIQRNVRIFDLVYLGCSLLVDNYKDEARLDQWRKIFAGVIQGYTELSPLSADELNSIPVLFLFDELLFTAFFFRIGQPEVAKSCQEMTNWMHENISSLFSLACVPSR